MTTRAKREKEKKRRQLRKEQAEQMRLDQQENQEEEALEQLDPVAGNEEAVLVKEYGDDAMEYTAPTSFEEIDDQRAIWEQESAAREVIYTTEQLVSNILYSSGDASEKSKKIQRVAGEFEARMTAAIGAPVQKDMDLLQLEALIAADARTTGTLEKIGDVVKEVLSSAARGNLPDSAFALPSKRKYPIHDKAHVRNALARAAQMIKRGGEAAADAKAALGKIRAAAKKMGIGGDVEKGIVIEKDAKGDWRWIGSPTNNFIDWQTDIISKAAHERYVAWLDANPEYAPVFMPWHTGASRTYPVDFWAEHEGAVIMSGKLTEDEAAGLFKAQAACDLGMSFQGYGIRGDASDPRVVSDYWIYEVSDLPRENAANPFTSLETLAKEAGMDKLAYLTALWGSEEKAKAFLEKTGQMQKNLQEAGITSKEKVEEPAPEPVATEPAPAAPAPVQLDIEAIVKAVGDTFDISGLNAFVAQAQEDREKLALLEASIKELNKSKEEQLAEVLTPPVSRWAWSNQARASQSETTLLKDEDPEDKKLEKSKPGVPDGYWLSEATNTVPVSPNM